MLMYVKGIAEYLHSFVAEFSVESCSCYDIWLWPDDPCLFSAMELFNFIMDFFGILDATANVRACCLGNHLDMPSLVLFTPTKSVFEKHEEDVACASRRLAYIYAYACPGVQFAFSHTHAHAHAHIHRRSFNITHSD